VVAAVALTAWALSPAPHFFPGPIIFFAVLTLVLHARRVGWARSGWAGPHHRGWYGPPRHPHRDGAFS
jgi:hypothetical protein